MISIEGGMANYGYAAFYGSLTETGKIWLIVKSWGKCILRGVSQNS